MTFTPNSLQLALLSAAILGFRHGFDYDHIAAISDITSVQTDRWRGMRLGLLYALGHAAMVAAWAAPSSYFSSRCRMASIASPSDWLD
jgi:high-affinity nickel permease